MSDDPWSEDHIHELISDWQPDLPPLSEYPNTSITQNQIGLPNPLEPPKQIGIPNALEPPKQDITLPPTFDYNGIWFHNIDLDEYIHITNIPDQIKGSFKMVDLNKKGISRFHLTKITRYLLFSLKMDYVS